jgi:hypothetical protein
MYLLQSKALWNTPDLTGHCAAPIPVRLLIWIARVFALLTLRCVGCALRGHAGAGAGEGEKVHTHVIPAAVAW